LWGEGLRLLGFNVDFAPVVDLYDGHAEAGIGDRAASADPTETAQAAGAFLHGLESTSVRGCLKHFPGLGGTTLDSHRGLPDLDDPARIVRNAAPFVALSHPDRLVMVAHLRLPATGNLPASLHRGSVLENPWGIQGRFLPDDLEMGGCSDWSWDDRVRLSLEAGHQWLLVCQTPAGWTACAESASKLPETLWAPALTRTMDMRQNLPLLTDSPFDTHQWMDWLTRIQTAAKEA
jgi:beta-N-acetylhexosaminidase